MWKNSEVKEKGMAAFKANYWMCVLVALIIALISGGIGGGSGFRAGSADFDKLFNRDKDTEEVYEHSSEEYFDDDRDFDFDRDFERDFEEEIEDDSDFNLGGVPSVAAGIAIFAALAVIFLIIFVISMAVSVFLLNPLKMGCDKFFLKNLEEPSGLAPVGASFGPDYKNIIKVLFFRSLFLFLWFLIPIAGIVMVIVKHYEYMMIPYLLAENPELTKDEAFALSKEMMHGQKWSAFGLDLSFIGWILLTIITFGILGVFYVDPYIHSTHAALYDTLKQETGITA